jgi:pimeloyl-ACP methyl ester carboxylesterase
MTAKPTLILLPGLLCDATVWEPQVTALAPLAEIRVANFRGFDSITAMAQAVLAAAPARFALAGHSMGARAALEVVRLAPERVERLALLDTGTHPLRAGEAENRQELVDLANRDGMAALVARWLPPMVHPDRLADEPLMAKLRAMVERMSPAIHASQIKALLERPDAEAVLPTIRCPVLVGVGRQDAWSPPSQHEAIVAAVPHAKLVVFENSGHMAPIEAPEAVTAALREWLAVPA